MPLVNIMIGAYDGRLTQRQAEFDKEISERISKIEESKVDRLFIESEEYFDLCLRAKNSWMKTRCKKKAMFIAGMLVESLLIDRDARFSTALKEIFLSKLDLLTDDEMSFLRDFLEGAYENKSKDDIYKIGDVKIAVALEGLLGNSILREADTWEKHIKESMLGKEFVAYTKLLVLEW